MSDREWKPDILGPNYDQHVLDLGTERLSVAVSTNTKDVSGFVAEEIQRVDEVRVADILTNGWLKSDFRARSSCLSARTEAIPAAAAPGPQPRKPRQRADAKSYRIGHREVVPACWPGGWLTEARACGLLRHLAAVGSPRATSGPEAPARVQLPRLLRLPTG
jgi:hypothetical protein